MVATSGSLARNQSCASVNPCSVARCCSTVKLAQPGQGMYRSNIRRFCLHSARWLSEHKIDRTNPYNLVAKLFLDVTQLFSSVSRIFAACSGGHRSTQDIHTELGDVMKGKFREMAVT